MGLFDTVRTNYRLPDVKVNDDLTIKFSADTSSKLSYGTEFQTKDMDCLLDNYLITSFGRLLIDEGNINVDTEYHGILNFYTYIRGLSDKTYFIEYHAKFTDGNLVKVVGSCSSTY